MDKDLKGKELGEEIYQQTNGSYTVDVLLIVMINAMHNALRSYRK